MTGLMYNRQNGHGIACRCAPCVAYWASDAMVDDWPTGPAPAPAECAHVLHEWPATGPWVDFSCVICGHGWRLAYAVAYGPQVAPVGAAS